MVAFLARQKNRFAIALAVAVLSASAAAQTPTPAAPDMTEPCTPVPVHKFTNLNSQSTFLTIADAQKNFLQSGRPDYRYDGIAYYAYAAPSADSVGVLRLYNPATNSHFYTTSDAEKARMMADFPGMNDEGYDHYVPVPETAGAVPVFRLYDSVRRAHVFATGTAERDSVLALRSGIASQGAAFFAFPAAVMSAASSVKPKSSCQPIPIYRFLNKSTMASFLTPSDAEKRYVEASKPEYQYQGVAFFAYGIGTPDIAGVHRFYNASAQTHFYTTSDAEKAQMIASAGAQSYEGLNFSVANAGTKALPADLLTVYRLFNTLNRRYLYALSTGERDNWLKTIAGTRDDGPVFACPRRGQDKPSTAGNQAPKVTLAVPSAVTEAPADIVLLATATDSDGSVKKVEFFNGNVKLGEAAAAPFQFTWMGVAAGTYTLAAVATDDKGATGTSPVVTILVAAPAAIVTPAQRDAARFLTQATFGINSTAQIDALVSGGYEAWLASQFVMPPGSHVQYADEAKIRDGKSKEEHAYEAIWQQWLWEPGQLRARVSFALSEIFVISNIAPDLDTYAMASYMDMLNRNAFGNYRQLLEDVTLHPAMGYYLNMIGSKKANPAKGTHPNENYAREVMQLFSIGLVKLNPDGSRQLGADGKPIATYDQSVVEGMAAAFTGWSFAGNDTNNPAIFDPAKENWLLPLQAWPSQHDTNAKNLFDGIVLPAGQSPQQDMKGALDALFNHPNVGPFIGRELIQRLVTSNPSPAYIGRVAAVFANNGQGVRGDLKAVIHAILLDPDARDLAKLSDAKFGKQREPVVRFANFLRAFNARSTSGRNKIWYLDNADDGLGQSPLLAPSVFNFFSPNYRQPGAIAAAGLVAPEFQITTETSMVGQLNFFATLIKNAGYGSGDTRLAMDLAPQTTLAADPAKLADNLNLLLLDGSMSAGLRSTLINTLAALPGPKTGSGSSVSDRVKAALIMISLSPEFAIQK
jgi:uncharacterized protein (DUF1800 family)